eukprot:62133-Lingulodinium_polyedra.AAC.1
MACTGRVLEQFSSVDTPHALSEWLAVDLAEPVPRVLTVLAGQHSVGAVAGAFLAKHLRAFAEV